MCAASTRWVQMNPASVGSAGVGDNDGRGTRGYSKATASVGDTFTIGSTTSRLYITIGSTSAPYITIYSGSDLDPRFLAKDITEKLHAIDTSEEYSKAICVWENDGTNNHFSIYSGELGSGSQVVVGSGTYSAHSVLGWDTKTENGGVAGSDAFGGTVSVSGTYYGLFSDIYKIVVRSTTDELAAVRGIGTPSKGGSNTYAGTITTGGIFQYTSDDTYTISIDTTNGTTMGAGTGNVPTMTWTSTGSDNSSANIELLFSNYWYNVGTKGLKVKFTDAVFNTVATAWTVACVKADYAQGTNATAPVGTAEYVWSSDRGDDSSSAMTTVSGSYTRLGSKGLYVKFTGTGDMGAGDTFYVLCAGPQPYAYNISSVNYGNVTVSTESPVKCVMFEVESGAVEVSTVKFGLQSHGTFSHHNTSGADTYFRFGTVGPANMAGSSPINGIEWYPDVAATDIDSDTPPTYLYATEDNLAVVATADDSESVGSLGLCADPVWFNIRLGASETGANSTINYRCYFDYC